MRKNTRRSLVILICTLLAGTLAFLGLYRWDNKYTAALSGGWGYNVLQAEPEEPAFLVDGWEFYPGRLLGPEDFAAGVTAEEYTYAGQHPNFSAALDSPYGQATYRIVLKNPGEAAELALYLPELLCAGRVYIGGRLAGEHGSLEPYEPRVMDGVYAFECAGDVEIIIQCANYTHYYSGMYYPPAVGTPGAIYRLLTARLLIYGLLCFAPLAMALTNLGLWLMGREKLPRRAGLLCLFFALRLSYPFLRALGAPPVRLLYAAEDMLGAGVLLCALLLAGELSGHAVRRLHRRVAIPAGAGLCAVTLVFPLLILPHVPALINTYGVVIFIWKLLAGLYLVFLASKIGAESALGHGLLAATGLYGLSLVISVVTANYFEPVRGAWPEEYGGFALVLGFAAIIVRRSVLLQAENRRLNLHLQEEVERKTEALETLLSERRELLARFIHDLKNPLAAVRNYAELVRSGGLGLDAETLASLDALSERVGAVEDRLDELQGFSRGERSASERRELELGDYLRGFYESNRPDMELAGQHFRLEVPVEKLRVSADEAGLRAALENLCYNALSFTPEGGVITLGLRREADMAAVTVRDTGSGIAPQDLPRVFERGFTRRADGGGEGLGLYVVRTFSLSHGGSVEAASSPGGGALFTLRLPLLP